MAGVLTFTQIENEVVFGLGQRTSLQTAGNTALWVKLAYQNCAYWFRHTALETTATFSTVASQRTYTFAQMSATSLRAIISMRNVTNSHRITRSDAIRFDASAQSEGSDVSRYARWNGGVELDPTPDGVQSVQCRHRTHVTLPATMDSTKTVLDPDMDHFVILRAIWIGRERLGETDRAVTAKADFMNEVRMYDWPVSEEEESDDKPLGPPFHMRY